MATAPGGTVTAADRSRPTAGDGELLLEVTATGLCGTDLFKLAHDGVPPGTVLGHEVVGRVVGAGAGVGGFGPGDRVVVPHHVACGVCALCRAGAETSCAGFLVDRLDPGGFAEVVRVDRVATALAARRLPDALADDDAVFLEPAACVLRGIRRAGLGCKPGSERAAVVLGGGSMGLLHLLVLRAERPQLPVFVSEPVAERRTLARELGATATAADLDQLTERVGDATDGAGADAVFDTTGVPAVAGAALEALRPGGTLVLFAHFPPDATAGFELNRLFKRERRVVGSYSGSLAEQDRVFELLTSGSLAPSRLVTHHLPLTDLGLGIRLARERRALKVLLHPEAS